MTKLITYDPSVVQKFASRLYGRATSVVVTSTLGGLILGAIAGGGMVVAVKAGAPASRLSPELAIAIGALVFGVFGLARGLERAFKLKLEAQIALCQVQIEANTRAKHS